MAFSFVFTRIGFEYGQYLRLCVVLLFRFCVSYWLVAALFISRSLLVVIKFHMIFCLLFRGERTQGIDSYDMQEFFTELGALSIKQPHLKSTQEEIAEYCFMYRECLAQIAGMLGRLRHTNIVSFRDYYFASLHC